MIAEMLRSALAALEKGETFALVTVIDVEGSSPGKPGQRMIVYADGRQEGTVGGGRLEQQAEAEALAMLRRGRGGVLTYELDPDSPDSIGTLCGGRATLAVEVVIPAARILLCGGGHIALAFARLCRELGFVYSVVDPREEMTSAERFPAAAETVREIPPRHIERSDLARYSHVLILTHEHATDRETLRAIWEKRYSGYIGMIGSKRKWAEIRASLAQTGASPDWLDRVHCPVGLSIGAQTPAQIAISIAAEIVRESHASPG